MFAAAFGPSRGRTTWMYFSSTHFSSLVRFFSKTSFYSFHHPIQKFALNRPRGVMSKFCRLLVARDAVVVGIWFIVKHPSTERGCYRAFRVHFAIILRHLFLHIYFTSARAQAVSNITLLSQPIDCSVCLPKMRHAVLSSGIFQEIFRRCRLESCFIFNKISQVTLFEQCSYRSPAIPAKMWWRLRGVIVMLASKTRIIPATSAGSRFLSAPCFAISLVDRPSFIREALNSTPTLWFVVFFNSATLLTAPSPLLLAVSSLVLLKGSILLPQLRFHGFWRVWAVRNEMLAPLCATWFIQVWREIVLVTLAASSSNFIPRFWSPAAVCAYA